MKRKTSPTFCWSSKLYWRNTNKSERRKKRSFTLSARYAKFYIFKVMEIEYFRRKKFLQYLNHAFSNFHPPQICLQIWLTFKKHSMSWLIPKVNALGGQNDLISLHLVCKFYFSFTPIPYFGKAREEFYSHKNVIPKKNPSRLHTS